MYIVKNTPVRTEPACTFVVQAVKKQFYKKISKLSVVSEQENYDG